MRCVRMLNENILFWPYLMEILVLAGVDCGALVWDPTARQKEWNKNQNRM